MNNHADEGTDNDCRIDFDHRSITLTLGDVAAEEFINATNELFKKHLREFMTLEGGMQQQALKLRIDLVVLQRSDKTKFGSRLVTCTGTSSGKRVLRRIACCAFSVGPISWEQRFPRADAPKTGLRSLKGTSSLLC